MLQSARRIASASLAAGAISAIAILASVPAGADPLTDILPPVPNTEACWERVYSSEHLASHPDQKVTAIRFSLAYQKHDANAPGDYYFGVDATTRDQQRPVGNGGVCFLSEGRAMCAIDCDGGGVVVRPGKKDGTLLVDLETFGYISLSSGCDAADESAYFSLNAEPDDKLFLLHRKSADHCATVFGSM